VLDDVLGAPALSARLAALLPMTLGLIHLAEVRRASEDAALYPVVGRLGELNLYVESVNHLHAALTTTGESLRSAGLRRLREHVSGVKQDATFQRLEAELPQLIAQLRQPESVTIGVNLDAELRPASATLLAIHDQPFKGGPQSLLDRLFNRSADPYQGLAPVHQPPPPPDRGRVFLTPLFQDLERLLADVAKPVADALRHYLRVEAGWLLHLASELAFYLGAARLITQLRERGLPMCRPEIAPAPDRLTQIDALFNVHMALRLSATQSGSLSALIVLNDAQLDDAGRIAILTGPNRGGKTTFVQAVGLAHVLFQAGLYVPGAQARLSPVDNVYTHFATEERPDQESGRLGEEARRIGSIFQRATPHSLVLMNETFASTSPSEGVYLAQDVLRALRLLGVRAIFATHLHDVAAHIDQLNAEASGDSRVFSLIAAVIPGQNGAEALRTYQIVPAPPHGLSYARDIARRYGVSFEQLAQTLRERKQIDSTE
jgi:hypothetical protein